jgi:hypothetical protein
MYNNCDKKKINFVWQLINVPRLIINHGSNFECSSFNDFFVIKYTVRDYASNFIKSQKGVYKGPYCG